MEQFQRNVNYDTCEQLSTSRLLEGNQSGKQKKMPPQLLTFKQISLLHALESVVQSEVLKKLNLRKKNAILAQSPNSNKHV